MCGAYLDSLFQFKALLICGNDDMWSVELTPLFFFFGRLTLKLSPCEEKKRFLTCG